MVDFIIVSKELKNSYFDTWKRYSFSEKRDLYIKEEYHYSFQLDSQKLIIIGDCINTYLIDSSVSIDPDFIINNLKGNFYAILINKNDTIITSSAFGLLPIYYQDDFSIISSSVNFIHAFGKASFTENKKWIVNQLLFNYQFFDDTYYKEIKLFPAFSYLKYSGQSHHFCKYFQVNEHFIEKPEKWNKAMGKLSDLFIKVAEQYIPDNSSVISFTGGFDGRALVSIASYFNKKFSVFSYGKKENDDVSIPLKNSKELNIPYFWVNLDQEYSKNYYSESATNYIRNTNGTKGFLSAHSDYAARRIKEKSPFLVSGVCGSELFRAAHSSGAVTSKALLDLFSYDSFESYRKAIVNSDAFKYINRPKFENEINEVISQTWEYKNNLSATLSENQKLYVFVYEEIFRKFFGNGISAQMKYINVRTPYIDFEFFKELLKTELSGAYSDFLTENPLKRFKGQILYTDIIKKTNRKIYYQKTGKGYAPRIVRDALLRPFLFLPFFTKRFKRKAIKVNFDNLGIVSGIKNYINETDNLIDEEYFNSASLINDLQELDPYTPEKDRDMLLKTLSISYFKNQSKTK